MANERPRGFSRILVINPNSSTTMTHSMEDAIKGMDLPESIEVTAYTAPAESPSSIDNGNDIELSTEAVLKDLTGHTPSVDMASFDAVLVACFSVHPLVNKLAWLRGLEGSGQGAAVIGIFEASILSALSLLLPRSAPPEEHHPTWGIVTTGRFWEDHLSKGVLTFLGQDEGAAPGEAPGTNSRFAGVESTGLNAGDFHGGVSPEVVQEKMREATGRLLRSGRVDVVVMGCAGMVGLEGIIRKVAVETYGDRGKDVFIVDGVRAGIGVLEQTVRSRRMFRGQD